MKKSVAGVAAALATALLASGVAKAEDETWGTTGVSVSRSWGPFVAGTAGGDDWTGGRPSYSDLFHARPGTEGGGRLEAYYDLSETWRFRFGAVLERWKGGSHRGIVDRGVEQEIHVSDLNLWGVSVGFTYRFFRGSSVRPYLVADAGVVRMEPVNSWYYFLDEKFTHQYWRPSYTYLADAGGGLEFALRADTALFLDVRLLGFGKPKSDIEGVSDASPGWVLPVSLGVNVTF